ncbi:MAG: hypothetical protein WC011_03240 [Candidatus Paceibacterota bacterium]
MPDSQFMTEVHPGANKGSSYPRFSLNKESEFIESQKGPKGQNSLIRVDDVEIGLVSQTEPSFLIYDNFKLIDQVGLFTSVPSIIFDPNYFDQEIKGSLAVQAGEYEFSNLTENEMLECAYNGGFYTTFDLSQVYSICLGAVNHIYKTLNKEGISYFFPILSKKGVLMGRINLYPEGLMFYIGKHKNSMTDVCWKNGVLISRYQKLLDPTQKI